MTPAPHHPATPSRRGRPAAAGVHAPSAASSGRAADVEAGRAALPALDITEWQAQLLAAAEESNRARAARAAERREKAERRKAGMASRHAWRQLHLDARAADADRRPPH